MAITAATVKTVRERDRGCRLCRSSEFGISEWQPEIHHVIPKGAGGTSDPDRDHPDNLILLHGGCHHWVHANPRQARALGLLASRLGQVRPSALIQRGPA